MKRVFSIVLGLMFFCSSVALATDVQPEQSIDNNQSYATLNLQKQPQSGKQKQGLTERLTILILPTNNGFYFYIRIRL